MPTTTQTTKRIKIRRLDGSLAIVEIIDAQHYEVDLEGRDPEGDPDDEYALQWRHEIVIAATASEAKRIARGICVDGETAVSARKLRPADVAVAILHGAQVVA
jgi:hypothetical protein